MKSFLNTKSYKAFSKILIKILTINVSIMLLLNVKVFSQSVDYIDFSQYGFRHKFLTNATYYYDKGFFTSQRKFLKGLKYLYSDINDGLECYLEIYQNECILPSVFYDDCENILKNYNNDLNFFSNIKTEKNIEPFGWMIFKGSAKKYINNTEVTRFLNVYQSDEYVVFVHVAIKNNRYKNLAERIVAYDVLEKSFQQIPKPKALEKIGVRLNAQGHFKLVPAVNNFSGYLLYRCDQQPTEYPNVAIYQMDDLLKLEYMSIDRRFFTNSVNILENSIGDIGWSSIGKSKFTNSQRKLYKYDVQLADGRTYHQYEIYYQFSYMGKEFLVILWVPLLKDRYLKGYEFSNLSEEQIGKEILQLYESKLISILESIEKL